MTSNPFCLKGLKAASACAALALFASSCSFDVKTMSGGDAKVVVPRQACDNIREIKAKAVPEEDVTRLSSPDYEIVGTPVSVGAGSEEPIFLDGYATLSFDIPDDVAKEDYDRYLGVCFRADGPVYFIPKAEYFKKGKIVFETGHFTDFGLVLPKDNVLTKEFVKRTAAQGWAKSIADDEFKKSLSERLSDALSPYGLGADDLGGQIVLDIVENNEYTSKVADLVRGKDGVTVGIDYLKDKLAEKTVEKLIGKLMDDPDDSEVRAALVSLCDKEGDVDKAVEKMRELSFDGAKNVAEVLGEGGSLKRISGKLAKSAAMKFSELLVPYVSQVKMVAETTDKLTDFWADNVIEEAYGEYQKMGPRSGGRIADEDWANILTTYMRGASIRYGSTHGLTNDEIRNLFERRASEDSRIVSETGKIEKYIGQWKEDGLLDRGHYGFGWNDDITPRLTMLYNVREKLRKEFVVDGDIPNRGHLSVEEVLDRMLTEYVACGVKDRGKFYEWALKQGYRGKDAVKKAKEQEKAGETGEYVWTLRRVDVDAPENKNTGVYKDTYSASETSHQWLAEYIGEPKYYENATFTSSCSTPPQTIRAGQTVRFHVSIKVDHNTAHYFNSSVGVNFDLEEVGSGGVSHYAVRAEVENETGSISVGSHEGEPHQGSCDLLLTLPAGREPGELRAINYGSCGCRTHWVYQWGPAKLDTEGISGISSL